MIDRDEIKFYIRLYIQIAIVSAIIWGIALIVKADTVQPDTKYIQIVEQKADTVQRNTAIQPTPSRNFWNNDRLSDEK